MSPKKKRVKKGQPQVKKGGSQSSDKVVQYVAIAVIVIIIAALAWIYTPRPQAQANIPASNAAICKEFASIPIAEKYEQPPLKIDRTKQYFANFKMAKGGTFVVQLYPDKAPVTVNSFVFLACKGFFNGLTFHRVIDGFMAQGGDPTGTGGSGPGYEFVNEDSDLKFDKAGVVAMANAGRDTNGSQFFITFQETPQLDGGYTIFGQVIEGMEVVNGITRGESNQPGFQGDAMESVTISEK